MRRALVRLKNEALKADLAPFEAVLVGRPNCGKSAIFNRLVKKNEAIVSPIAGTTRDRKEGKARLGELEFSVVDTGGLEDVKGEISEAAQIQTKYAIEESDAIIFCVDAKTGVTRDDEHFARFVRKFLTKEKSAILLANKTEGKMSTLPGWEDFINDCMRLGMGYPVAFSAVHGEGLSDLHDALLPVAKKKKQQLMSDIALQQQQQQQDDQIKVENGIANVSEQQLVVGSENDHLFDPEPETDSFPEVKITILGRPNAGKSTLLNTIVGSERVVVGPTPGLTRDATEVSWTYENRPVKLVDTAGWRSKQRSALYTALKDDQAFDSAEDGVDATETRVKRDTALLEGLSVERAFKALSQTHVAVLMVDIAATGTRTSMNHVPSMAHQDLAIAGRVVEEGKPLVIVVNKIDQILVRQASAKPRRKLSLKEEVDEPENVRPMQPSDLKEMRTWVADQFSQSIPETAGCPILLMSAKEPSSSTVDELMQTVLDMERKWSSRVKTSKLNRWLAEVVAKNPPPSATVTFSKRQQKHGRRVARALAPVPVKLKYATQVSTRPPTFCVFVNRHRPENALDESYKRYLMNQLKDSFDLHGVPVRLLVRSTGNPFADGRKTSASGGTTKLAETAAKVKNNTL